MTQEQIRKLLKERAYDPANKPAPDSVVLSIDQRNIGSLGNFIILSGLPKTTKSKFTAAMMAAALTCQTVWDIRAHLPENKRQIAFFDTDQSTYDFYKNVELVNTLCGMNKKHKNLFPFTVRREEPHTICNMIDTHVKDNPQCGLIMIDNVGDLLNNFNDEGQSKKLINYFKKVTDERNILIIATLHLGKSNNSTIGHLGAMADRYAQTVLTCEKISAQYQLKLKSSRTAGDFTPIAIQYNDHARQWEQTSATDNEEMKNVRPIKARPADISPDEHRHKMRQIFYNRDVMEYDELLNIMMEYYGSGRNWCKDCLTYLRDNFHVYRIDEGYTIKKQTRLYKEQ